MSDAIIITNSNSNQVFASLPPGTYQYEAIIATGPILIQRSVDYDKSSPGAATWTTLSSGSLAASEDNNIDIAAKFAYRFTVPSGDQIALSPVITQ